MRKCFVNCRAVLPTKDQASCDLIEQVTILVSSDGIIEWICQGAQDGDDFSFDRLNSDDNNDKVLTIDCQNSILAPGFIDIQINGAFGVDFSNPDITVEQINYVRRRLLSTGVTSFLITLVTCSRNVYHSLLEIYGNYVKNEQRNIIDGAIILGVHLEGPFFHASKRGAHNVDYIESSIISTTGGLKKECILETFYGSSILSNQLVKIVTLAPEIPGAMNIIQKLRNRNIIASMGHTNATRAEGKAAVKNGAKLITHLFNAMRSFHHREPGLLGLIGEKTCHFSIIVDGLHSHPSAVALAYNTFPHGLILVTDAMSAMGLADGKHSLGSMEVTKIGRSAKISGSDTLAGSVVSMIDCVRSLKQFTCCSLEQAISKCTLNPTKLGIASSKGMIEVGKDADFVFMTDDLHVMSTWVHGRQVYIYNSENLQN